MVLGSKLIISASRVATKIARRAGEGRRAYRGIRSSPSTNPAAIFAATRRDAGPLALLLVAHDRIDHIAPRQRPKCPASRPRKLMSFDPGHALLRFPHRAALSRCAACRW